MDTENLNLEEQILKESIVSAAGLNTDSLQIGIKGDPSLRESTIDRKRYNSTVDDVINELEPNLEELMLNRGTYQIFVGFNSGEIRTTSIFDPLRTEIHTADKLASQSYINRQFPEISYDDKIALMNELYDFLRSSSYYKMMPDSWRNILQRRSDKWEPLDKNQIPIIFSNLKKMREMQEYYLRNVTVSIVTGIIRLQFNCDGTQLLSAKNYQRFLEENLP